MTKPKTAGKAPKPLVIDDPAEAKGRLRRIGGSKSDVWNNTLANR